MLNTVAIIGRPNVGKSTLFNKLTKSRSAIVSNFSGLTKDRNYGLLSIGDSKTFLIDTGGIDSSKKESIENEISEQAWIAVDESSLVLFVIDGSEELTNLDSKILENLRKRNKKFIAILNKNDKKNVSVKDLQKNVWYYSPNLETHTVETHIYRLRKKMKEIFGDENFIFNNNKGYSIN